MSEIEGVQGFFISNRRFIEPTEPWWPGLDFGQPDYPYDPYKPDEPIPVIVVLPIGGCGNGPRQSWWPQHRDHFQFGTVS